MTLRAPAPKLLLWLAIALPAAAATAQQRTFEVALRDGRVWIASACSGDPERGFEFVVDGQHRRVDGDDLLAVHGAAAAFAALPAIVAPDGDVVHGSITGGDANGERIEVTSPVLGRLSLSVDRTAAIAAAGVRDPLRLVLPEGVDEALFLRAGVGHDVLAGALHRCGERGLLFAPDGAEAPRWFQPDAFVALRIADANAGPGRAPALVTTRLGDRIGAALRRWADGVLQLELEDGAAATLRQEDLASLCWVEAGTFLSDLEPTEVQENGFDAEVLHPWRRDAAVVGDPLVVGGRTHGKGLGVHSQSRLVFTVPADAAHFWTRVGIDDTSAALGVAAEADVRVLVDGTVAFEQRIATGRARDTGLIEVRAGQTVALEVDFGPGREVGDRVDWLSPVFVRGGRRP